MRTIPRDESVVREGTRPLDRPSRVVADEEGRLWRVREVQFADAPPSLVFESDLGFRRVRVYPRDWKSLPEKDLYALSWRT